MPFSNIIAYSQSAYVPIKIEFYYKGEIITNPVSYFKEHQELFEQVFPSPKEIMKQIVANHAYKATHKLLISEYGFHRVPL